MSLALLPHSSYVPALNLLKTVREGYVLEINKSNLCSEYLHIHIINLGGFGSLHSSSQLTDFISTQGRHFQPFDKQIWWSHNLLTWIFRSLAIFFSLGFIQNCNFLLKREREWERALVVHLDRWCSVGATHKDSTLRLTPDCLQYGPAVFNKCSTFSIISTG